MNSSTETLWIDRYYDFPIKRPWKPTSQQLQMTQHMVEHPRGFNLSDTGSMKTLAALWAADIIMQTEGGKTLIVAPLSIIEDVWNHEIRTHFIGRRVSSVVYGDKARRLRQLAKEADFYIINHDGLAVLWNELRARHDIRIGIYDEASVCKIHTTRRSQLARSLFESYPYFWALTASPCSQAVSDAFGVGSLVHGRKKYGHLYCQGHSFTSFKQETMTLDPTSYAPKFIARDNADEIVHEFLQPSIRFDVDECIDLPSKNPVEYRHVELSAEQRASFNKLKREACLLVTEGKITAVNAAVLKLKLLQIICGGVYTEDHVAHFIACPNRLKVVKEIIDECRQKVIIYAPFTSAVTMLGEKFGFPVITGGVSLSQRGDIFAALRTSGLKGVVCDPGTVQHGLNLTCASVIIWYAPPMKTEQYKQANARIYRSGQEHHTTVFNIHSTPIDKDMYLKVEQGLSLESSILKLIEGTKYVVCD